MLLCRDWYRRLILNVELSARCRRFEPWMQVDIWYLWESQLAVVDLHIEYRQIFNIWESKVTILPLSTLHYNIFSYIWIISISLYSIIFINAFQISDRACRYIMIVFCLSIWLRKSKWQHITTSFGKSIAKVGG